MELKDLKPGIKLEIDVYDRHHEHEKTKFVSQIESNEGEDSLYIATPIYEGVLYPLRIGTMLNVYYLYTHSPLRMELYNFLARVTSREKDGNVSLTKIEIISDLARIQRREFFRTSSVAPFYYRIIDDDIKEQNEKKDSAKTQFKDTISKNISGGGVGVYLNERIPINSLLECRLMLKDVEVAFIGMIIRICENEPNNKYGYEAGVVVKKIESADRDRIIRYVFDEQRKLRKKGLI